MPSIRAQFCRRKLQWIENASVFYFSRRKSVRLRLGSKKMSKNYVIFDKKADSVTVASFLGEGLSASERKNLFELGFDALEDARLSRALSVPFMGDEFCGQSPCEFEGGGEDREEEVDVLMNLAEDLESTAESSERERVTQLFQILRDMVGLTESIDALDVFEQTIRSIKKLQMDLRSNFC